ncbi:MAG: hypothetical protein JRE64_13820, partial [Deltaproteobacteria bacterium]|nr:hypothetical protein [Deltaproteobacteria bacterium]
EVKNMLRISRATVSNTKKRYRKEGLQSALAEKPRTKIILDENELPKQWYNILPDLPTPLEPPLNPATNEPIMKVVVETPTEYQGAVMGSLNQRRGIILASQDEGYICVIEAQIPLAEMFGYSTVLRSLTQGKAQFTMEFYIYKQVPNSIAEELAKKAKAEG